MHTISLTEARKRLKLTQPALAEQLGVDVMTVWRWEQRVPTRGPARKIVSDLIAKAEKLPPVKDGASA
jgi:DNA-binding transcriptional regulator YiaG